MSDTVETYNGPYIKPPALLPFNPDATVSGENGVISVSPPAPAASDPNTVQQANLGTNTQNQVQQSGVYQSANYVPGVSGWILRADGSIEANAGFFRGALVAGSVDIPDTTTTNSFHVDNSGNAWWGASVANFNANNNNAAAFILKTGVARFTSITLSSSVAISGLVAGTELAIQGYQFAGAFSAASNVQVNWGSGTLTFLDGETFSISSGNTGTMSAITYIYFDKAASTTVLQTTTTAANAVGTNKVLLAVAQNVASGNNAIFQVFNGNALGGSAKLITASDITAGTITANQIAANTITANKLSVSNLAAISANLGAITAGTITIDTAGYVRGGQTDYNVGTGFFLGYSGGGYKFSIGDGGVSTFLDWDGTMLTIGGNLNHLPGTILYQSANTARQTFSTTATRAKEILLNRGGAFTIKFDLASGNVGNTASAQIYKNGSPVGTLRTTNGNFTTFSENITGFVPGDLVQLFYFTASASFQSEVQNFQLYVSDYDTSVVNVN